MASVLKEVEDALVTSSAEEPRPESKPETTDAVQPTQTLDGVEPTPEVVSINMKDFKGIYRGPRLIEQDGRPMIDLGIIDSPSLVTGIGVAVNKTALEIQQLKDLVEWAVQYQLVHREYSEKVGTCDCPMCKAKAYVDSKLGGGTPEPEATPPAKGPGGHYF